MEIVYEGQTVDFKAIFYQYICHREGVRNTVYKDTEGFDTVGVGHLVTAADGLKYGDIVSNEKVQQFFEYDYNRLGIAPYAQEIFDNGYTYNMALAVCSFIWAHGLGNATNIGYKHSELRKGLVAGTFTASSVQTYLAANWDLKKPKNQVRNRKDFEIGFSTEPWTPAFFLRHPTA